jgi:hypothetical protein
MIEITPKFECCNYSVQDLPLTTSAKLVWKIKHRHDSSITDVSDSAASLWC